MLKLPHRTLTVQSGPIQTRRTATRPSVEGTTLIVDNGGEFKGNRINFEDDTLALCSRAAVHALSAIEDQLFVENAINGPESDDWKRAINEELTQIEKLGTWKLVEAPNDANVIPC